MGGILAAIVSLLKAAPVLERLFLSVAKALNEARAEKKHEEELDEIDAAIAAARGGVQDNGVQGFEWSLDPDRSPPVSEGGTSSTRVHSGSVEGSGKVE
jgi:hypothetical protein